MGQKNAKSGKNQVDITKKHGQEALAYHKHFKRLVKNLAEE